MGISGAISRGAVIGEHAPGRDGHATRDLSGVRPRWLVGRLARRRVLRPPGVLRDARPHPGLCRAWRHAAHARCALRPRARRARHLPRRRVPPRPVRGEHHPASAAHRRRRARLAIQPARGRGHSSARRRRGSAALPFHKARTARRRRSRPRVRGRAAGLVADIGLRAARPARQSTPHRVCPTSAPTSSRSAP